MVTYNIEIREFNGVDYDILHPITTIENVEGLNNSLTQLSQNITNVSNALSNKVNKSGDTMTGNLSINKSSDPTIYFIQNNTSRGGIFLRNNQLYFNQYAQDQQEYREAFTLPLPSTGMTSTKFYSILTSKNLDTTPTAGSANPVTSGGVKTAVDGKVSKAGDTMTGNLNIGNNRSIILIPNDTTKMGNATISIRNNEQLMFWHRNTNNTNQDLYLLPPISTSFPAQNNYYDILTSKNFDDAPTANSNNPVKSKGIKTALDGKVNKSGDTMTGNLQINRDASGVAFITKLTSSGVSSLPSSDNIIYSSVIVDKDMNWIGQISHTLQPSGKVLFTISAINKPLGSSVFNTLSLGIDQNGNSSINVSSPDAWRNGLGASNGVWPTSVGGTGITSNPSMLVNLGSASASNVFATSPRPGVTGTLPVANGGTGANNKKDALSNLGVTISNTPITEGSTLASGSIYIYYE